MFLRGYGWRDHEKYNGSIIGSTSTRHSSSGLGLVQGDSIRNISGIISFQYNMNAEPRGAFYSSNPWQGPQMTFVNLDSGKYVYGGTGNACPDSYPNCIYKPEFAGLANDPGFSAERIVPTANENRPVNIAVKYVIKAR